LFGRQTYQELAWIFRKECGFRFHRSPTEQPHTANHLVPLLAQFGFHVEARPTPQRKFEPRRAEISNYQTHSAVASTHVLGL
jgi:hypothetical protein